MTDDELDLINSLSDVQKFESFIRANGGLDAAMGVTPEEFHFAQDNVKAAWVDAFSKACQLVAEANEAKVDDIARESHRAFQCAFNPSSVRPWADILPEIRLKWEFLIRHVVNLLTWLAGDDSVESLEFQLVEMFRQRLASIKEIPANASRNSP